MCGRYVITSSPEAIRALFRYLEQPYFPARYNIAPTQPIPVVRIVEGKRTFTLMRWGLIPAWVKDPRRFSLLINARGESLSEKPAFRYAMRRRRCLVPADGFYEWKRSGGGKRPYFVRPRHAGPIAFAGLWETWMGPNGEEMDTAYIITTVANRTLVPIHGRMPVIVAPDAFELWLDCIREDDCTAAALIAPPPDGLLEAYEISAAVNHATNDSPDLVEPLGVQALAAVRPAAAPSPEKPPELRQQELPFFAPMSGR
jgi:putative SOS response-associated peptidase YedK